MRRTAVLFAVACLMLVLSTAVGAGQLLIEVTGPKADCVDVPVSGVIPLPVQYGNMQAKNISVTMRQKGGSASVVPGQVVFEADGKAKLWWVMPKAEAGKKTAWVAEFGNAAKTYRRPGFSWRNEQGEYLDMLFDGRKVTRYMYAYDKSTPDRLHETYKVFHHVFDAAGEKVLTKGPDGETPYQKGTYTHHRGIYIGWNKTRVEGQQYDFWHMKDVFLVHQKITDMSAGPVLGSSTALIHWIDKKGEPVIAEKRQTTVFCQSDPTILLLEFRTDLTAVKADVILDGDPEHAGFQYRPHNDVAAGGKDVKAKYLFHKDGIDAHKDQNLPWAAMSYGLNGKRYSVLHMNHPDNPTPSVYSAYRDYGRFGAFFKDEIKKGETLSLKYRVLVQSGSLPERKDLDAKYLSFVQPPEVDNCRWE